MTVIATTVPGSPGRSIRGTPPRSEPAEAHADRSGEAGVLYRDEGRWQGRQIVPAAWVREATTNQLGALEVTSGVTDGYGYMWWTKTVGDDPAYLVWGYGGQLIEVIPNRGLVIVASCEVVPLDPNVPTLDEAQLQYLADSVIAPLFDR